MRVFVLMCFGMGWVVSATQVCAQTYVPVDSLSSVKFIIRNMGMNTTGKFSGVKGSIRFNPSDLKNARFSVSIDAASVNTEIEPRDQALRGSEYLDAGRHPNIVFESKQVIKSGDRYVLKGFISLRGIQQETVFPFEAVTKEGGVLFTGEMKLNRRDFSIGTGSTVLSDVFSVVLSVFARKT
jgi:polyisoprenoid-binding protein YceI